MSKSDPKIGRGREKHNVPESQSDIQLHIQLERHEMHLIGAYHSRGTWREKVVQFAMPKSNKHTLTFETKNELSTSSLCPIPLKHTFS